MAARRVCLSFALLLSLGWGQARAQSKVAVLGVETVNAPEEMAVNLALALRDQVKRSSTFTLEKGKALEEIKLIFGCLDESPACMAKVGRSLAVDKMVWGTLKKVQGGLNLTIKLLDVSQERVEKFVSENFPPKELEGKNVSWVIEKLTRSFLVGKPGSIKVNCNVQEAQVLLDSRPVGITAAMGLVIGDIPPGTQELQIQKTGFKKWTQLVTVKADEVSEVIAVLEPTEGRTDLIAGADDGQGRRGWKIAFWTGMAVSAGLAAAAIVTGVQVWNKQDELQDLLSTKYANDKEWPGARQSGTHTDACTPTSGWAPPADVQAICDAGDKKGWTSTGLWIAAGGAIILSSTLFGYMAYLKGEEQGSAEEGDTEAQRRTRQAAGPRWQLAPSASPDGAGLNFRVRF